MNQSVSNEIYWKYPKETGKFMSRWLTITLLACLILGTSNSRAQEEKQKNLPEHHMVFMKIQKLWIKKEYRHLQKYLAKRVTLNLGKVEGVGRIHGRYPREKAVGILKEYFQTLEIKKFHYFTKKMKPDRAVALYRYRLIRSGIIKHKLLYINLEQEKKGKEKKIVIISLHVIG